jgi:hypothetical protein
MDEKNIYIGLPAGEPSIMVGLDRSAEDPLLDNKNNTEIKKRRSRLWLFPDYCLTLFYAMPFSLRLVLAVALLGLSFLPSVFPFNPGFPYGSKGQKVRGVNLGGWLVLEVCTYSTVSSTFHSRVMCASSHGSHPVYSTTLATAKLWMRSVVIFLCFLLGANTPRLVYLL